VRRRGVLPMWQGFRAQEGTYEISGDTLTLRSEVAKNPRAMAPGAFQKFQVQLQSRMIWLKVVADSSRPLPNQERVRLIRIEQVSASHRPLAREVPREDPLPPLQPGCVRHLRRSEVLRTRIIRPPPGRMVRDRGEGTIIQR